MHTRLWIAALLAATPILALSPVAFPGDRAPGCVRPDPSSNYNQRVFTSLMRRTDDKAKRTIAAYNVLRVKSREIRPVTEPVICARAAVAYGRAVHRVAYGTPLAEADAVGRRVHILRVGDRYIVMDPEYVVDEKHRAVTFDSTFSTALAVVAE